MAIKIVVVEDEGLVAADLEDRLILMGYEVCQVVDNGPDALAAVEKFQPEIVLLDIRIRGSQDGVEVASILRESAETAVIFLTAHADAATLERARFTEPYGYLLKPFNDRELRATIEMAVYRHRTEGKLRKMERWLSTTLDSIGDGVITTDTQGKIRFLNPVAEMVTGWRRRETIGKDFHEVFTLFNEHTQEPYATSIQDALKGGAAVHHDERLCLRSRTGNLIPIDESVSPIREGGETSGVVVIFRDRTQRKMAMAEKQRLEARLQETQKLESLGLLASGVAHDFNNILGVVTGNLSLMRDEGTLSEPFLSYISQMEQATQRAAQLCTQMLAHAGQGKLASSELDFSVMVEASRHLLKVAAGDRATLELELAPSLPQIEGDPRQLQQILVNLITNSAEALGEKAGVIKVKTESRFVPLRELQNSRLNPEFNEGTYVILEVHDDGAGMPKAVQEKVFEAFFTTKFQGRGLGLAAVAGVVKAHKATLTLESQVNAGTRIRIYFPAKALVRPLLSQVSPPVFRDKNFLSGLALAVDDEPEMLNLVKRMLESFGLLVLTARDGKEAVDTVKARGDELKVVVIDLTMPVLNGREATACFRATHPDLPVVVMSGYEAKQASGVTHAEEFANFLHKPFSLANLREQVRKLVAPAPVAHAGAPTGF